MSNATHTPGTLFPVENDNSKTFNGWRVETAEGYVFADQIEKQKDAHLIAAAPELLDAAKALKEWASHMGGWESPVWDQLNAAIAKATGETDHSYKTDYNCSDCVAHRGYMA